MNNRKTKARKERVKKMQKILLKIFPSVDVTPKYNTTWEFLVFVILSAQCTDKRVIEVMHDVTKKYKTVRDYAKAKQKDFEKDIFQTGFYKSKAKNVISAAKMVCKDFRGKVPSTMEELIRLPGVGRKTANVVLGNQFNKTEGIAVDTHVRRFAIRFDLSDHKDAVRIEQDLMEIVEEDSWGIIDHLLIAYGREVCPARQHDCKDHPLTKIYPKAANIWPKAK